MNNPLSLPSQLRSAFRAAKWIMKAAFNTLPASLEILFHHTFGIRYLPRIWVAVSAYIAYTVARIADNPTDALLHTITSIVMFAMAAGHTITALKRSPHDYVHSYSAGSPWQLTHRFSKKCSEKTNSTKIVLPMFFLTLGFITHPLNPSYSAWCIAAVFTLYFKYLRSRTRSTSELFDTLDNLTQGRANRRSLETYTQNSNHEGREFHEARPAHNNRSRNR